MRWFYISEEKADDLKRKAALIALGIPANSKQIAEQMCDILSADLHDAGKLVLPDYMLDDGK